jgi:enoyl-CoA hydratase/carnithine racemase
MGASEATLVSIPPDGAGRPVLNAAAVSSLHETIADLGGRGTRAAVLAGHGGDFCVGGDHAEVSERSPADLMQLRADIARLEHVLRAASFPIVGFACGRVIGGGVELLLCCDLVVADSTANFSTPHVAADARLGPALTGALVARVGSSWARRLLLLGERVDGTTAAAIGLADRLAAAGQGMSEATAAAAMLGSLPRRALARARADLDYAENSLSDGLRTAVERLTPRVFP